MKKIVLCNPPEGSDIHAQFVAVEDEKRDAKHNVTNSFELKFNKNSELELPEKTAIWALKTWGFLYPVKEIEEIVEVKIVETAVLSDHNDPEVTDSPKAVESSEIASDEATVVPSMSEEEEFEKLKEVKWKFLAGPDRDRYKELKRKFKK